MSARKADQARQRERKDHKPGETADQIRERVLKHVQETTGGRYRVTLTQLQQGIMPAFVIAGYGPDDATPAIRIKRSSMAACGTAFEHAAGLLAAGFGAKPERKRRKKNVA